ncbi:PP2C family protein-serine/threonine phosphatase [Catellatospora sp. KI3]|uniref:PP2C family protein-serine/threonine phosphatase n=1 Tax=Catellatospora sp. KI3 TaxID=3041620 RepID=UPI00248242DB|nr:PP2C family protein-serine/threonine phosphatase [Catellatospora sp. KI3]MDI1460700.1 PP2C family protein-serine/threonine phosphatase [Catellatospora sp. KI3]
MRYDPWHAAIIDLLQLVQHARSEQVAECVGAALRPLRMETTCYLADVEQRCLRPIPERGKPTGPPLEIETTLAGRAYTTVTTQYPADTAPGRLWVPLVDGSERLGVVEMLVPGDLAPVREWCETYVNLAGHLIGVKMPYGDALRRLRRSRPMTVAAEMLTSALPPLTFTSDRLVVSAILEPRYDIGGDAFDYALDGPYARFLILDAVGRGLSAAVMSVTALGAIRAARQRDPALANLVQAAERSLAQQFGQRAFVTGLLCELDTDAGVLRYVNAGHPFPLLLRGSRTVGALSGGRRMPLGLADARLDVGEENLEPGDRLLLFSDGVVEARNRAGEPFGEQRLADLAERAQLAKLPAPETLRQLARRVVEFPQGPVRDDATLMLVEWSAEATRRATV